MNQPSPFDVDEREVVPLAQLRLDGDTQMRAQIDHEYLDELAALFDEENPTWPLALPPGNACRDDDGTLWVWDGFHRYGAARQAGCVNVPVVVRPGSREAAQWLACSANKAHGARRTNADKQRAIALAVKLSIGTGKSAYRIAQHVGVNDETVSIYIRKNGLAKHFPTLAGEREYVSKITHSPESGIQDGAGSNLAENVHIPQWAIEEAERKDGEGDGDAAESSTNEPSPPSLTANQIKSLNRLQRAWQAADGRVRDAFMCSLNVSSRQS